jgi:peptidoglycan/xylan/chitin deacetylase (PgdA/CDA1 family)
MAVLLILLLVGCASGANNKNEGADDPSLPEAEQPPENGGDNESEGTDEPTPPEAEQPSVSGKKRVALTLDDGPHNVYTKKIVDELAKYGAHATFFVVGNRVDGTEYNGRSGLQYAIENGNEIGIHGYTHKKYYNRCTDEEYHYELSSTLSAIRAVSSTTEVKLMRPIGGAITDSRVEDCPYAVILWNVDSEDWKNKYSSGDSEEARQAKAELIANRIISTVKEDSIILMHDIYESTYDALVMVLAYLYDEGYEVVTVSELLGSNLHSGEKYYSGKSKT